ncbi:MAG: hypothetical protein HONDAALG_04110 [Gammaproteobacteria bacterium]|nr:hypothetical protein [Gammaproteobacteria bacterium]
MNDTLTKKSELVIDALQYAHDHNLDINNIGDVQKILDVLDPDHKENVAKFAELLKTSDTFMGMKARDLKSEDKLPN